MSTNIFLLDRIQKIVNSPALAVHPVGLIEDIDRGIMQALNMGRMPEVLKRTFGAVAIAAALAVAPQAHASGVGYDSNVYGQQQGQVMQLGTAVKMSVVEMRPVKIEVTPTQQRGAIEGYAVTAAGTGIGALIGSTLGGRNDTSRAIGSIVGGLAGAVAGNIANEQLNHHSAQQVDAKEITLLDPATNRLSVITQAGDLQFAVGDRVLVTTVGGNTRVVPDHSPALQQNLVGEQRHGQAQGHALPAGNMVTAADVVHAAATMGIRVDADKVADMLEHGAPDHGSYTGKVVGIDRENGLLYQSSGRGAGIVHDLGSLSMVPEVGENITIRFNGGRGTIDPIQLARGRGNER
jgi:outer membrane lipoprotein SlyB